MERIIPTRNAVSLHIGTDLKEMISSTFLPKNKYDDDMTKTIQYGIRLPGA